MICVGKHVKEKYRFSCILELEDKEKRKQKVLNSMQKITVVNIWTRKYWCEN